MLMTPLKSFVFLVEIKNLVIITSMRPRRGRLHYAPFIIRLLCKVTHQPVSEGEVEWELPCVLYGELSPRSALISHMPAKRQ